jgi:hypothetical protein
MSHQDNMDRLRAALRTDPNSTADYQLIRQELMPKMERELAACVDPHRIAELRQQLVELNSNPTRFNEILPASVVTDLLA